MYLNRLEIDPNRPIPITPRPLRFDRSQPSGNEPSPRRNAPSLLLLRVRTATLLLIGTMMAGSPALAADPSYPSGQWLIEPTKLAESLADDSWVILDARDEASFAEGHIPGAIRIDHGQWAKAFSDGQDAAEWSQRIGELGIAADTTVVLYDDVRSKDASRIWWILRYWGLSDARLLNGGWLGWQAADLPIDDSQPSATAVQFEAVPAPVRLATKDQLIDSLADRSLQIVDTRSAAEFCGIKPLDNQRAGAVPGAKHLEWVDLIDDQTHRFKPADELKRLFDAAGIRLDRPTATYCQSGGRASVMAYGLELMGASDVRNYYRSWAEWGNVENTPVIKPESPNRYQENDCR